MATVYNPSGVKAADTLLTYMSNLLQEQMYKTTIRRSPWNSMMIDQIAWKDGVGDTGRVNVFGATYTLPEWVPVTMNSLSTDVPLTINETGATEYSFQRSAARLASQKIDVTRIRQAWENKQQAANILDQLVANVGLAWSETYRAQYTNIATFKCILTKNGIIGLNSAENITTFAEQEPDCVLTSGVMDRMYNKLQFEGAFDAAAGMANGAPVFTVMASRDTTDYILQEDPNIRQDIRFMEANFGDNSYLMHQLGATKAFRNFVYLQDSMAPRYDFDDTKPVGQKWVRIHPYVAVPSTTGNIYIPNEAYDNAPFEDTIIFVRDVFKSMVVPPFNSADKMKFNPRTFNGEVRWINNPDMNTNYLGTQGMFVAELSNAAMPVYPRHGIVIRHLRVAPNNKLMGADGTVKGSLLSTPNQALVSAGL